MTRNQKLEERLNIFAVNIIRACDEFGKIAVLRPLANQLLRSGTSPALNYGEAQGAESKKDFIHKISIALKEIRESRNCLKIIMLTRYIDTPKWAGLIKECDELGAILYTIQRNLRASG